MSRVAIELVTGARYQAVCRVETCDVDGHPWRGEPQKWLPAARTEAYGHKDSHLFDATGGGSQ